MSKQTWKEAASIILLARSVFSNTRLKNNEARRIVPSVIDYKVLSVKRSAKSSFMPNGYVFPGGLYHAADSSNEWLALYKNINIGPIDQTYPFTLENSSKNIKIRQNSSHEMKGNHECLPKSLTFRITAIRELFEETGLLLAKNSIIHRNEECFSSSWASYLYSCEILDWQEKVQKNPYEFIKLCEEFSCVPDVWSLKDWSFWQTPAHLPTKKFSTPFFVAALSQIPPSKPDNDEISDLKWETPGELLEKHNSKELWLPPPQFYELSRIKNNFENLQDFVDFASKWCGCDQIFPVGIKADDGWVYLLPGDEMYPSKPEYFETEPKKGDVTTGMKIIDLRKKCSKLHRVEIENLKKMKIVINYLPTMDHVYPELIKV